MQYIFPTSNLVRYRFPTHTNDLVMDRSEAAASEVFVVILKPGEAPPMHKHEDTEQIFFVIDGEGKLEIGGEPAAFDARAGDVVRIPINTMHRIHCVGTKPMKYLAVDCFPGGRPGAEPTWDSHARVMCTANSWDYDRVVRRMEK